MNIRICKPLLLSLAVGLASLTLPAQAAPKGTGKAAKILDHNNIDEVFGTGQRPDVVPDGEAGRYYLPSGSGALDGIIPSSYSSQFKIDANFRAGLSNRCGSLDFTQNITQELQRVEHKLKKSVQELQQKAMTAISGLMSGFFQYALMKINPVLGEITTKQLDEYLELFNLQVKECEDYEREVRQGKNPFGEIAEIAIGEQWKTTIGMVNNKEISLDEAKEKMVAEARKNGVPMTDGKNYGGEGQEPINITKSLLKAGMNLTLSRGDKKAWDSDFATNEKAIKDNPILGDFKNAKELYNFVEEIYGANEITLQDSAAEPTHTNAIAGRGYERKYAEYRNEYYKDLSDYVDGKMEREAFEKKTGQVIAPIEIDDIRIMPPFARKSEILSRARQYAIGKVRRGLIFARQALKTGVYAPDLQQSGMKGPAETEFKNLYYRIQDDIREIGQRATQY
ncbi:hypothetical protein [Cardiobacterium hominis]|jgi:hypothetical protein|uniref:hypothetical protein n=1 Tax=Cardiobacterium hominis TaxID=2718 RepID=UPI0028EC6042|nr:hypothetical protein [Cardiobacterium hominis]